jgi:hypothetical protein
MSIDSFVGNSKNPDFSYMASWQMAAENLLNASSVTALPAKGVKATSGRESLTRHVVVRVFITGFVRHES